MLFYVSMGLLNLYTYTIKGKFIGTFLLGYFANGKYPNVQFDSVAANFIILSQMAELNGMYFKLQRKVGGKIQKPCN